MLGGKCFARSIGVPFPVYRGPTAIGNATSMNQTITPTMPHNKCIIYSEIGIVCGGSNKARNRGREYMSCNYNTEDGELEISAHV